MENNINWKGNRVEHEFASLVECFLLCGVTNPAEMDKAQKRFNQIATSRAQGWPILGNIFDLGTMPHQTLYRLRSQYGPVLWLQLGAINTVVIQSAKVAAELFKNHDLPFSDRKVPCALTALNYNQGSMAMSNYGTYWRTLRKVCSSELLVIKRINEMAPLRHKCVDRMIQWIEDDATMARVQGGSGEPKEGNEFYDAMNKIMELAGKPNTADFFPFLKWLDPQGIKRNMVRELGRAMDIIAGFVKERVEERQTGIEKEKRDFLDVLLEYRRDGKEGSEKLSERNMNIIILEMFFGGTETTSSTIEWAMTELLRKPKSMRKVKEELDRVVGPDRKVEESDIDELLYLQAVVKETLRLHPALPLLIPRNALQDTNFMGYFIPQNTQVFVNAWSIGRDPEAWHKPLSFKPRRFLGSDIDYKGQNFELIPFGSGRRMCIGMPFAHKVVPFVLASLLHCFDWELGSNLTPETIDMNERVGLTLRKLVPLKAIPRKRIVRDR
ncbi:Cytochrome P450 76A2 [Vitis vinifera]|uniref:Cytochrome P450 76A2 n=1 Tax=Vitis vinifera TaxID=29760 RepID=A0A438EKL7_VITVI|nr:Cytochrome P450 76A2 [Vitis vinifera]